MKNNILEPDDIKFFESRHKVKDNEAMHITYHMVSATGCVCENRDGRGSFDSKHYDPIRVAEPFLVCIREMLKYGMYYEDKED